MSWTDTDLWAFDVETNGTQVDEARILTAALVRIRPDGSTLTRSWVLNPQVSIPAEATAVNGLTEEWITEHGTDPAITIPIIVGALRWVLSQNLPLVAQNASFDLSILANEAARYEATPLTVGEMGTVIDTLVLARGIDKVLRRRFKDPKTGKGYVYKLPALCERYKVPFEETHDASADALGSGLLAQAIGKAEPQIADYSPGALFKLQRTWHKANQDSLAAYFDKTGKDHDVDSSWPLHSSLLGVSA